MIIPSLLSELKALFAQRDSLPDTEAGRRWLARVAALIEQVDPDSAAEVRHLAQILTLSLSTYTIGPVWKQVLQILENVIAKLEAGSLRPREDIVPKNTSASGRVFIGHGRSPEWKKLKELLVERLGLVYEEFNREPAAGYSTKERLEQMLSSTDFAFLVMTAEDEHSDGSQHARENVIHEIGLFQGRHGFERAIVLLEQDCSEFSNIQGITQIRFPPGDLLARSEEIRRVVEREGILSQ